MPILSDLSDNDLAFSLKNNQLAIQIGAFRFRINSRLSKVKNNLSLLYSDYPVFRNVDYTDFRVKISSPALIRKWIHPQINFYSDGYRPFLPLPKDQAFALLEWGMNWCLATQAHHYLMIHAAIIEKNGKAIVLPGSPGSGKSTLCAALVNRGWRLLSDEMTIINPSTLQAVPNPRPVSLKNQSINVIKTFAPETIFGDIAHDTSKGTVSHMKPPTSSVTRAKETCEIGAFIFPKYRTASETLLTSKERSKTLIDLADNSFNYHIHALRGFDTLKTLVTNAKCYDFVYSDLHEAMDCFNSI